MNYQKMKSLIDSLIQNFKCPNCSSSILDNNADIVGAAGNTINVDMICPNCSKHTMVRAEMAQVNLGNISGINLKSLQETLTNILPNGGITKIQNDVTINEKQIIDIKNAFKDENIKVEDFLK